MTTTAARSDIVAFAAAVRAQLDDLPAEDADELLDGLEADLSDQAAEAGDAFEIPDAGSYAAELRAAAGLPGRAGGGRIRRAIDALNAAAMRRGRRSIDALRAQPITAWILDTLVAVRPVWWLLRAVVAYLLVIPFLPIAGGMGLGMDLIDRLVSPTVNLVYAAVLAAFVILSIQWGRGRWAPFAWVRVLRAAASVILAIATPFVLVATMTEVRAAMSYVQSADYDSYIPGLAVDGERVRNIFAYDADGTPIDHVQLFDQNGRPLTTVGRSSQSDDWDYYYFGGGGPTPVGEREIGRLPVWNIFPLREVPSEAWMDGEPEIDDAVAPTFPFAQVPSTVDGLTDGEPVDAITPAVTESPAP